MKPTAISMKLAAIEPRTFPMGVILGEDCLKMSSEDPDDRSHWDEAPAHEVTITYPFGLSAMPVTNGQYACFRPAHRQVVEQRGLTWRTDEPVECVTWDDAVAFCRWWSEAEGRPYRLPTEAEWECAARCHMDLGLSGMGELVREWCGDWWAPYPAGPQTDPIGPAAGTVRVIRGGSLTNRGSSLPGDRRA
ncbi:MAG: formylglycine-generating enzyme family protein, partial [Lentisphaerae bacterium]|nr:formylglycine-generating enzyme family protein [Lentisphaerota bacterium]